MASVVERSVHGSCTWQAGPRSAVQCWSLSVCAQLKTKLLIDEGPHPAPHMACITLCVGLAGTFILFVENNDIADLLLNCVALTFCAEADIIHYSILCMYVQSQEALPRVVCTRMYVCIMYVCMCRARRPEYCILHLDVYCRAS